MNVRTIAAALLSLFLLAAVAAAADDEKGFVPLFDGKTLNGWKQLGGKAKYVAEDGAIVGSSVPNTSNSFLCTEKNYGDFILELEFKVDPGLELRRADPQREQAGLQEGTGPRLPGRDRPRRRAWSGGIYDEGRRGWLNDLKNNEAARKAFKPKEWNKFRIECRGDSIKTWINGVPAADLKDSMTKSGFIALQVHGVGAKEEPMYVRWRNIRLKDLAADAPKK